MWHRCSLVSCRSVLRLAAMVAGVLQVVLFSHFQKLQIIKYKGKNRFPFPPLVISVHRRSQAIRYYPLVGINNPSVAGRSTPSPHKGRRGQKISFGCLYTSKFIILLCFFYAHMPDFRISGPFPGKVKSEFKNEGRTAEGCTLKPPRCSAGLVVARDHFFADGFLELFWTKA